MYVYGIINDDTALSIFFRHPDANIMLHIDVQSLPSDNVCMRFPPYYQHLS